MAARRSRLAEACIEQAVSYVRVSKEREEMISPVVQQTAIQDHVQRSALTVVDSIEDLDRSGRNFARAGIQRIIAGVEEGLWTVVLVYRYDRFGRNVRDSLVNIARVEQHGGRVVSVTEPFDTDTAIGKYGRTNILAVAELQSDIIGENWKGTHRHRIDQGLPHDGRRRFGYVKVEGRYQPDPVHGPVLRDMYLRYTRGETARHIADWINSQGIRTHADGAWSYAAVLRTLDSGWGAGLINRHGQHLPGIHDPIIAEPEWRSYLIARKRNSTVHPRSRTPSNSLSGLVRCGLCGSAMTSRSHGGVPAAIWGCQRHQRTRSCPGAVGWRPRMEKLIRAWVLEQTTTSEDRGRQALRVEQTRAKHRTDRALAKAQLVDAEKQRQRLVRLHVDGKVDRDTFDSMHAEITGRIDVLTAQTLERPELPTSRVFRPLAQAWDDLNAEDMNRLLRTLIERIEVRPGAREDKYTLVSRWGETYALRNV